MIKKLIVGVDEQLHREGWDLEPFLGQLVNPERGTFGMIQAPIKVQHPAEDWLDQIATMFAENTRGVAKSFADEMPAGLIGFCFAFEAWRAPDDASDDDVRAVLRSGKGLADMIGATECRNIIAVDINGQYYEAFRVRGGEPEFYDDSDADDGPVGLVVDCLRRMALGVMRQTPGKESNVLKLETMKLGERETITKSDL